MNDCCTDGPKTQLIALPDYESAVRDDPLALLTAIDTCVHENARAQHPPVTISTHWDPLLKLKEAKEEDPPSCAKRFEQQLETVKGCHPNEEQARWLRDAKPSCQQGDPLHLNHPGAYHRLSHQNSQGTGCPRRHDPSQD